MLQPQGTFSFCLMISLHKLIKCAFVGFVSASFILKNVILNLSLTLIISSTISFGSLHLRRFAFSFPFLHIVPYWPSAQKVHPKGQPLSVIIEVTLRPSSFCAIEIYLFKSKESLSGSGMETISLIGVLDTR